MYTYKYNIYKNAFSFKLLEEAVIFKTLKYTVPSFARSFTRETRSFLLYTLEASFSPRKESVHNIVQMFQTLNFQSLDSLGN